MIKIKNKNVERNFHQFDYELEDGKLLHCDEWNGEDYTILDRKNHRETVYTPIYSKEPNETDSFEIIGFEKIHMTVNPNINPHPTIKATYRLASSALTA